MWYGVYNKQTEILKYASAGHPPALLINKYGEPKSLFTRNYVIGAEAIMGYVEEEVKVSREAKLYIFSDGTYEIFKSNTVPWNVEALHRFLENVSIQGKDELHELYKHQIEVNGSPQLDDDFSILKIIIK
jgi:sigma-B regulation protein RsbU (phosphoserine phosphatase)